MKTRIWLQLTITLVMTSSAWAQQLQGMAGYVFPLDPALGSARAKAMGSAFVGMADDASALWWNPVGLGQLAAPQLSAHYNQWLVDTSQGSLVFATPIEEGYGLGLGINYVSLGQFENRASNGVLTGTSSADEWDMVGGYCMELSPKLWAGLSLQGHFESLAGIGDQAYSGSLGILWAVQPEFKLGLCLNQIGWASSGSATSSALRLGGSEDLSLGKDNQLLLALAGELDGGSLGRLQIGAEDKLFKVISVRAGYQWMSTDMQLQWTSGLQAGVGFTLQGVRLDCAIQPFGDLGTTNLISLTYQFDQGPKKAMDLKETKDNTL